MKTVTAHIRGIAPLILHSDAAANPLATSAKELKAVTSKRKKTDEDLAIIQYLEWEAGLYWDENKGVVVPAKCLLALIRAGAKVNKLGTKVMETVFIQGDNFPLEYPNKKKTLRSLFDKDNNAHVDTRMVVIGRARIARTRPIFPEWELEFSFVYAEEAIEHRQLELSLVNAGLYKGLCDFRPQYGRFEVTKFE